MVSSSLCDFYRLKFIVGNDSEYGVVSLDFVKSSLNVFLPEVTNNVSIDVHITNKVKASYPLSNSTATINSLDFSGRQAYVSQLFNFDGCFVTYQVGSFTIRKDFIRMDQFRFFSTIQLEKKAEKLSESEEYGLIDTRDDVLAYLSPRIENMVPKKLLILPIDLPIKEK